MEKAKEILEKMENVRTWKESGVTMSEVADVLNNFIKGKSTENEESSETKRLKTKIERLTESNKQLMAENKKLKGNK